MNTLDLKVITPMIYPKPVSRERAKNATRELQLCNILTDLFFYFFREHTTTFN